ncbi:MAG TPA: hypothetical protein P5137_06545 [Candidatus Brocadiia bacterium]|nr:hypothetical protein [Candidatus Brocadiia bacterium]
MLKRLLSTLRVWLSARARALRARRMTRRPIRRATGARGSVSMITSNYRNADTFGLMLRRWIEFAGGKPFEVVVTDGGADQASFASYGALLQEGLIDKLYAMRPDHPENSRATCFVQEFYSGVMASAEYLFFFKTDTIPFRRGHDRWMEEYIEILAGDPGVFAITGSSPGPGFLGPVDDRFWCLEHTSMNFALMRREHHVDAMRPCWDFWRSGWRGVNPFLSIGPTAARCMIESAWDVYCRKRGLRVLMEKEDATWSVFHTNARGAELLRLCERARNREGLEPFYNRAGPFFLEKNLPRNG